MPIVNKLLLRLDHLPLAIVQAAAYIRQSYITIDQYLDRLEKSEAKLLAVSLQEVDQTPRSVMTTWKVSYDYICSHNPSATALLDIMSCLDFQDIQRTVTRTIDTDQHVPYPFARPTARPCSVISSRQLSTEQDAQ